MKNTKLGVIFGGMSTEHDISVISGKSIINNLKKEKYEIYPIYIDKQGNWYKNAKITIYIVSRMITFNKTIIKLIKNANSQSFYRFIHLKIKYIENVQNIYINLKN